MSRLVRLLTAIVCGRPIPIGMLLPQSRLVRATWTRVSHMRIPAQFPREFSMGQTRFQGVDGSAKPYHESQTIRIIVNPEVESDDQNTNSKPWVVSVPSFNLSFPNYKVKCSQENL